MTPSDIAAKLRHLDRVKAGARAALAKAIADEAAIVSAHEELFPFTLRNRTYEAWRTRSGRAYARVTVIKTEESET